MYGYQQTTTWRQIANSLAVGSHFRMLAELGRNARNTIQHPQGYQTRNPQVFAAGDIGIEGTKPWFLLENREKAAETIHQRGLRLLCGINFPTRSAFSVASPLTTAMKMLAKPTTLAGAA